MNPQGSVGRRPRHSTVNPADQMGVFTVFFEFLGVAAFLPIGVRFLTAPELSDGVAWGFLVVAAIFLIDATRRLYLMARGRLSD